MQDEAVTPPVFTEQVQVPLCTQSTCSNGHSWVPRIQVVECVGCKSPILAVAMVNCPRCNEPADSFKMRAEHVSLQMGLSAACQGQPSRGEGAVIEMKRTFYKDVEEGKA